MPGPVRTSSRVSTSDNKLAKNGRQLTRMVDMFWCPNELLVFTKRMCGMNAQGEQQLRETASEGMKRLLALHNYLCDLDGDLVPRLMQGGANSGPLAQDAKKQLNMGQINGKSEDMQKVKENIGKWRAWNPPLPDMDEKVNRGMNHDECAYLLCDPTIDWDDHKAKTQFISFGNPPMNASLWGRYLWASGQYNPNRTSDGLLKGELLVKAAQAILFSPVTSKAPLLAIGARGSKQRGTIGIAKSYELSEVTPAFIAYVAVAVRHALTSDEVFGDQCGRFHYIQFYNQIHEYLESPTFKKRNVALMHWWNKKLFSGYRFGQAADAMVRPANGTLANLEAEIEGDESDKEREEEEEDLA